MRSAFQNSVQEIIYENTSIRLSSDELGYLYDAYTFCEDRWEDYYKKLDKVKILLIGEAPLFGKTKGYIYNIDSRNTSFLRPSDFFQYPGPLAENTKNDLLRIMEHFGILVVDLSPLALNSIDTPSISYSKMLSNRTYNSVVASLFNHFTAPKVSRVLSNNPDLKVLVRYKRLERVSRVAFTELDCAGLVEKLICVGSRNMGIDRSIFNRILVEDKAFRP